MGHGSLGFLLRGAGSHAVYGLGQGKGGRGTIDPWKFLHADFGDHAHGLPLLRLLEHPQVIPLILVQDPGVKAVRVRGALIPGLT